MEIQSEQTSRGEHTVAGNVGNKVSTKLEKQFRRIPVSPAAKDSLDSIMRSFKSLRGRRLAEKVRPHIEDAARLVRIGTATADIVNGVILTSFGFRESIQTLDQALAPRRILSKKYERQANILVNYTAPNFEKPMAIGAGAVLSGALITGIRPISILTDVMFRAGKPLATRVAGAIDTILLRQEQQHPAQQVFVGTGKA